MCRPPSASSLLLRSTLCSVPHLGRRRRTVSRRRQWTLGHPEPTAAPPQPTRRPVIENTSPDRYRVQFTIGKESHDRLRKLQALLRREIPDGDAGAIVERALVLLLER